MSLLDRAKKLAGRARGQAANLASQHSDKIDRALHKGGDFVDSRTHGKYSDRITKARTTARDASTRLAAQADTPPDGPSMGEPGGATPPPRTGTTPPPPGPEGPPDEDTR